MNFLLLLRTHQLEFEVSCMELFCDNKSKLHIVLGFWNNYCISIYCLPDFELKSTFKLPQETICRSLSFVDYGSQQFLFISLGDGKLNYFEIKEDLVFCNMKSLTLGSLSVHFKKIQNNLIIACAEQPFVIYYKNGNVSFSHLNEKNLLDINAINYSQKECLVYASADGLCIGNIEELHMQKLHVKSISLQGKMGRRICYQAQSHSLGILTSKLPNMESIDPEPTSWFQIYDIVSLNRNE